MRRFREEKDYTERKTDALCSIQEKEPGYDRRWNIILQYKCLESLGLEEIKTNGYKTCYCIAL